MDRRKFFKSIMSLGGLFVVATTAPVAATAATSENIEVISEEISNTTKQVHNQILSSWYKYFYGERNIKSKIEVKTSNPKEAAAQLKEEIIPYSRFKKLDTKYEISNTRIIRVSGGYVLYITTKYPNIPAKLTTTVVVSNSKNKKNKKNKED